MSKKVTQSNKTYQIRPSFKDKFRPAVITTHPLILYNRKPKRK